MYNTIKSNDNSPDKFYQEQKTINNSEQKQKFYKRNLNNTDKK